MKSPVHQAVDAILVAIDQSEEGAEVCQVYCRYQDVDYFKRSLTFSALTHPLENKGLRIDIVAKSDEDIDQRKSLQAASVALILAAKTIEMMGGDSTRMSLIKSINTAKLLCENAPRKAASLIDEHLMQPPTAEEENSLVDYLEMDL